MENINPTKNTARIVGLLFIIGTISGILSAVFSESAVYYAPAFLAIESSNRNQLILSSLFVWLMGFSLAMIPVIMYSLLKKQNQVLAIGYIVFRGAIETITYIGIGVCILLQLDLGQSSVKAGSINQLDHQILGSILLKTRGLISLSTIFVFSFGAILLYIILFRSKLIPQWLSTWGLVAVVLHLATGFLMVFGLQSENSIWNTIMNLPIFVQEMVMAVLLIVKGFNEPKTK